MWPRISHGAVHTCVEAKSQVEDDDSLFFLFNNNFPRTTVPTERKFVDLRPSAQTRSTFVMMMMRMSSEVVVELKEGDSFLFPDALIHHSNEPVIGKRFSIVTFTQENILEHWRQKFP
jgi:hypothetical protein